MTKREFVVKISSEVRITQQSVTTVVQKTLDCMADELASGRGIEFRDFGVFEVKVRKSRKGRNPNKPKVDVVIPEHAIVKFHAGKELRERVGKLAAK